MCGIVGVCGKILAKEENVFKTLLCLDTIRGPDSTGILAVSATTGFEIFKKTGTPWDCFGEKGFEKIFKFTNALLLGHNRAATVGHISDENAHPFDVGNIIGVHNGTLRNEYKLDDNQYFNVDSETLLHNFEKNGVADTIKIVDGALAVVFYDKRDHTLHMLRNNERPLSFTYSKDRRTMFWASEAWMLHIACARYGLDIGEVKELPPMVEHSFQITREVPSKVDPLPEMDIKTLVKYEPKSYYYPSGSNWKPRTEPAASNVTNIGDVKKALSEKLYKKMMALVGKDVNFSVSGFVDGKHQKFIRAYAELPGADVIEIRIFMDQNNKKFKELVDARERLWQGHVKRANILALHRGYLLLDNRTIKISDPRALASDINPREKSFNLFRNKPVTLQEWLDATSIGCDNCGDIPGISDAEQLEWYDNDKFFCKGCYATQNVQNYLSLRPEE